ncbi:MAG: HEAT repeat domain-containing protein [Kiritimatiellae bacterium]|nr:HEAT repeat domain-containing protein [Kiritimatiellia bacterium]
MTNKLIHTAPLILMGFVQVACSDTIHLKNGRVIDGEVISADAEYIEIKLPFAGEKFTRIRRKDVTQILRDDGTAPAGFPVNEPVELRPSTPVADAVMEQPVQEDVDYQSLVSAEKMEAFEQGLSPDGTYDAHASLSDDADYKKRNPALLGLAACGDIRGIQKLEQMLLQTQSSTPPKASAAVILDALEKAGSPSSVAVMARIARSGRAASDRRAAVWSLGKLGFPEAMAVVEQVARDSDAGVRAGAAFAAGRLNTEASRGVLVRLLQDPEMGPKLEAAKAVENNPFPAAVPALIGALSDRYAAAPACLALGKLKSREAVLHLLELLNSTDPEYGQVRQQAARGLGMIGDPQAIDPLVALLGDTSGLGHMCAHALSLMVEDGPASQKPSDWLEWAEKR